MKKALSVFLAILLITLSLTAAYALNYDGFIYTDNGDGTCTITSYRDFYETEVIIPLQINGLTVTQIAANTFKQKTAINTVSIPDSVISVGNFAFYGCTNLRTVIIGSGVKSIGDYAFDLCKSLTGVNLQNVESVGMYAFLGCSSLTDLFCGNALKTIGKYAFWQCGSLEFVKFSSVLESIGDYAFAECTSVTSLTFPDSLKTIGTSSFSNLTALTTLTFGNGELKIGPYAFENCTSLTEVTIPQTVTSIGKNAFAFREKEETASSHPVKIICNNNSAGVKYAIDCNAPVYIIELDRTVENFGDIDGKNGITTEDARKALRLAASVEAAPTDEELFLGDINRNGYIDTEDAFIILSKASGITW